MALVSLADCRTLASESYKEIGRFLQSNSYLTTGASVFGWRDRRQVENNLLKFSVKKFFHGLTPLELSLRGWEVTSTAHGLRQLYSPSMNINLKRVQVVDGDNVVIYRVIHSTKEGGGTVKSLFLVTRFQTETGFVILFRSIDHTRLSFPSIASALSAEPEAEPSTQWMDMFTW